MKRRKEQMKSRERSGLARLAATQALIFLVRLWKTLYELCGEACLSFQGCPSDIRMKVPREESWSGISGGLRDRPIRKGSGMFFDSLEGRSYQVRAVAAVSQG